MTTRTINFVKASRRDHLSLVPKPGEKRDGTFASLALSKDKKTADLEIWDFIGEEYYGTTAKEFITQIKELPASVTTINVDITSPGGWIWDTIAMYQALKDHPATVNTRVSAIAASAATIVFMAGDNRIVGPYADFMIHEPWAYTSGNAKDIRKVADRLDQDKETLIDIYTNNGTNKNREEIASWVTAETWMKGSEAVDKGFATEMVDDLAAAACLFNLDDLPGCQPHHKAIARAFIKRSAEHTQRDAGDSRRQAKAAVSDNPQRDVVSIAKKVLMNRIQNMEKLK